MTHLSTPQERMMMFHRGFGDGARTSAHKHPDDEDYMHGWDKGNRRARIARLQFANRIGYSGDDGDILR